MFFKLFDVFDIKTSNPSSYLLPIRYIVVEEDVIGAQKSLRKSSHLAKSIKKKKEVEAIHHLGYTWIIENSREIML